MISLHPFTAPDWPAGRFFVLSADNRQKHAQVTNLINQYNAYCTGAGARSSGGGSASGTCSVSPGQTLPDLSSLSSLPSYDYGGKYSGSVDNARSSAGGMDLTPPPRTSGSESVSQRSQRKCSTLNPDSECAHLNAGEAAFEQCFGEVNVRRLECAMGNYRIALAQSARDKAQGLVVHEPAPPCFLIRTLRDAYCANFNEPVNARCDARYEALYSQCIQQANRLK